MFTQVKVLNNGVAIPMIGLGVFRMDSGNETSDAVCTALQTGYRHIDTAAVYGNEQAVGEGIRKSGVPREEIFITTKLWNDDMRSGKVEEAFRESLSRLGTDYIDLYLVHWPVEGKFVESYRKMERIYATGAIKAIGVSNFNPHHLDELAKATSVVPAVNQIELHPQLSQKPLREMCAERGIAIEAYAPFGGAGAPVLALEPIQRIAEAHKKSPAQVVLRWNVQNGTIIIPKSSKPERIAANAQLDFALSAEEMAAIDALNRDKRYNADPETFDF